MERRILCCIQNLWPFSLFKFDDLRESDKLVRKLSIPEHSKQFVFAIREPELQSVIYILCVQNLSERSAMDVESLVRAIKPDAVVAQVGHLAIDEMHSEETEFWNDTRDPVPTSSFEVLKRCFLQKTNKAKYDNLAGGLVLREIFGIGFYGHLLAAKRVAEEVGSSFLLLQSPFMRSDGENKRFGEANSGNKIQSIGLQPSCLVPQRVGFSIPSSSGRFILSNDHLSQMGTLLTSYFVDRHSAGGVGSGDIQPREDYEAPQFAQSVYPLLIDLHSIFQDIPSIGTALAHAQRMLDDVNRGEIVDSFLLSKLYVFRIAVEGLRIALTNMGRIPINKMDLSSGKSGFSDLPVEEKSHALLAQALRGQSKRFKSIVAVVDVSSLAGLRKHFNTTVPPEVKNMVEQLIINCEADAGFTRSDRKRLLTNNPVVAVGAGATAVLGLSSFSKVVPASTFIKLVTFNVPFSLKLAMTQTQKAVALAFGKIVGPSNVFAPGIASSGANTTSAFKAFASAERIRNIVHGVIGSAEKTSVSAMRIAFYEIMRKRQVRPVGLLPWATFGCSIATCTGLLVYGDGIECAAESIPAAPSIATLGRGIQSLQQASQAVRHAESFRIQRSIESLLSRLRR